MKNIVPGICFFAAVLFAGYGGVVASAVSGSLFFVIWFVGAAACLALGIFTKTGWIKKLPFFVRIGMGSVFAVLLVSFILIEGFIIGKMHVQGRANLDYVLVLGSQVRKDGPSVVLKYRLDKAIAYLKENPDTICIVSGGQGKNEPYSEAYGMAQYLIQNGIEENRILLESNSKTTEENILYSKSMIKENSSVGIITNDFHMFRALQIAEKKGLSNVCGIAADSSKWFLPNNMLREYMAEIKFLLRCLIAF